LSQSIFNILEGGKSYYLLVFKQSSIILVAISRGEKEKRHQLWRPFSA